MTDTNYPTLDYKSLQHGCEITEYGENSQHGSGKITIRRIGDIAKLRKIIFRNCGDDFVCENIRLVIGGQIIHNLQTDILSLIHIDYVENITIDGERHKIFHLDKLNIVLEFACMLIMHQEISVELCVSGSYSSCVLNVNNIYINNHTTRHIIRSEPIISMPQPSLCFGQPTTIQNNGTINIMHHGSSNGIILTGFTNINTLSSIEVKFNNATRLFYEDEIVIRQNCDIINENTIYIPLNSARFNDDIITNQSIHHFRLDNISVNISLNNETIQNIYDASYNLHYAYIHNNIYIPDNVYGQHQSQFLPLLENTSTVNTHIVGFSNGHRTAREWKQEDKPLTGNTECPVTLCDISQSYIKCGQCNINLSIDVKNKWLKNKNTCPHCRSVWKYTTIYNIPTT